LPDLRKDPVTGRWVVVSTERTKRPADFHRSQVVISNQGVCPFCPGNESRTPPEVLAYRSSGGPNQPGWSTRVVPHRFPALRVEGDLNQTADGLYDRMNGIGAHEVIIDCPEHVASLADALEDNVRDVFFAYRDRALDLKKDPRFEYIQLFKNQGQVAGGALEHTHTELIALPLVPHNLSMELKGAARYFKFRNRCVFCDIVCQELANRSRIVLEGAHVVVLAPFASRCPFELWVLPKRHGSHFEMQPDEVFCDFAACLLAVLASLDRALERPAYNLVLHTAPLRRGEIESFDWHLEIVPRLSRTGGFAMGTGFYLNPTPPEEAARFLRESLE
jgi:UDPglucose--hexose-1-phosphate uridylyltransferase